MMDEQLEQWARKILSWHEDEACIGDCTTADRLRDVLALIAEVRRLRQQVENITAVNDAVGRERDIAFQQRDAAIAELDAAQTRLRGLAESLQAAGHEDLASVFRVTAERDAALAERDALRDVICPQWREKGLANHLASLASAHRSDSETMDEIGEDFDVSYRQAVAERDAARKELAHWQTCSQCGEQMDAPGHCTSGQAEWAKGQSEMFEQAIAERDAWRQQAIAAEALSVKWAEIADVRKELHR